MRQTILIVTAAGLGKRMKEYSLKKYGRYVDKPLVELRNKKLLEWSIKPFYPLITTGILKFENIFIVIRSDQDEKAFKNVCMEVNANIKILLIDKLSRGPAHTTYEACQKISTIKNIQEYTILASDSDHTFRCDNLLNFFKDEKRKNYNSYCVLKEVSNPEKWGYVIKSQDGSYLSGEKDILIKSEKAQKAAEFLIGCYIYNDLLTLKKGINLFEVSKIKEKESHHSLILSLLSKTEKVQTIKSNWGMGLGTPAQLEKAENSLISFTGNREPATYVIDIDGVILKHDLGCFSPTGKFDDNPRGIDKNIRNINNLYESGCLIILLSSRPLNSYLQTINDLEKLKVKFSKLILGATSGIRYLINDRKPSNMALNSAVSINSIRNKKFRLDHTNSIDFIKDCTKGSGASTLILRDETNDFSFVRKWTNSINNDISKTLYRQFSYIQQMNEYISYAIPEILDWNFSKYDISYYDMEYIDGKNLEAEDLIKSPKIVNNLCNILSTLYDGSLKAERINYNPLLKEIIRKKLIPTIELAGNQLEGLINDFENIKNINLIHKLLINIESHNSNNSLWGSHSSTLIHGDLTLENIFKKDNSIYLIDPLGSTMDINSNGSMKQATSPIFDLGKLFQSLISQYETWAYLDINSISTYIRNFSIEEEKKNISETLNSISALHEFYKQYINGNILDDSLFSLAQILIRVCPYRVRAKYNHSALICLLKANAIMEYLQGK